MPFTPEDEIRGELLFTNKAVKNVIFSGGTYQIEVHDAEIGRDIWVMLQLGQQNEISDYFCTCDEAEKMGSCPHLSAARRRVFLGEEVPLHERYEGSLWRYLLQIVAKHLGFDQKFLTLEGAEVTGRDREGKAYFHFIGKNQEGLEKLGEFFHKRSEDQSFKISGLTTEELSNYRAGNPTFFTRFELSFWSDVAKWLLSLYETKEKIEIHFADPDPYLPTKIVLDFSSSRLTFTLDKKDWPVIIPCLSKVNSPISVYELRDIAIRKIFYLPEKQEFKIDSEPVFFEEKCKKHPIVEFDDWTFVEGEGFFAKKSNTLLLQKTIEEEKIPYFLEKFPKTILRFLDQYHYEPYPEQVKYYLSFSPEGNFLIRAYLFENGDLNLPNTTHYPPWVFIESKGFYRLSKMEFPHFITTILREEVCEFIEKYRLWLSQFEGFSIHLASIETKMAYRVFDHKLIIESEREEFHEKEGIFDFGRWIYIEKQGFYAKGRKEDKQVLFPTVLEKEEISDFIDQYKEELEQIPGFFTKKSFIQKSGLEITLDESNQVVINPKFIFLNEYRESPPPVYGHYVYLSGLGFAEIPDDCKLPKKYLQPCVINPDDQSYFFKHEFIRLKPYIIGINSSLEPPKNFDLQLFAVAPGENSHQWKMKLAYVSEFGVCPVKDLWQAIHQFQLRLFTSAGRIELKDQKFPWLNHLSVETFQGDEIILSTLDWIQLQVLEKVTLAPQFVSKDSKFVQDFFGGEAESTHEMPNLRGLKSELRPYQKLGVRWLWFLYTYGLSGFLCDEMGLGKTHQAMALLAAVMNYKEDQGAKFIVVCPTSVIYHWEGLLNNFLKKAKVVMYHGSSRRPKDLGLKRDIILTSYGILRSDLEEFVKHKFEVAIFDEIHFAKNQRSLINRALRSLDINIRVGLTGTPIENHLIELKALFNIVVPQYLPSDAKFRDEFVIPIERNNDIDKQKILSKLISPFMLRRKKTDVLDDLPEKIEEITYVDLSEEQKRLYAETYQMSEGVFNAESTDVASSQFYLHVFALINRLKQICDHPALVLKNIDDFEEHSSGKWDVFVEKLEEVRQSKQKLVVFSQYLDMLAIMEKYLKKNNIGYASITGSTRDRKEELRRFKEDPHCEVFLASLLAAGVGIDLVSASVVIHYDRWWNPAKENQATDRVHRIGQNRGVSVFKLVSKSTIEEHIHNLITKKHGLLQNIVGYDLNEEIKKIDREELIHLLKLIKNDIVA